MAPQRNLRPKSTSAGASSTPGNQAHPLPADTPEWGVALFELLNNVITTSKEDLHQQITELINVSVQKVEVKSEKAIVLAENNKQALDILSAKIDYMKDEIICLKEQNNSNTSGETNRTAAATTFCSEDMTRVINHVT